MSRPVLQQKLSVDSRALISGLISCSQFISVGVGSAAASIRLCSGEHKPDTVQSDSREGGRTDTGQQTGAEMSSC